MTRVFILIALLTSLTTLGANERLPAPSSSEPEFKSEWNFSDLEKMPMQSGGRVQPFLSVANDLVLYVSGKRSIRGWNNAELLLSWVSQPQYWFHQRIVKVAHQDTRRQLLLDLNRSEFTPAELFENSTILQYIRSSEGLSAAPDDKKLNAREGDLKRVLVGLIILDNLASGKAFAIAPVAGGAPWKNYFEISSSDDRGHQKIHGAFTQALRSFYRSEQKGFEESIAVVRQEIQRQMPEWSDSIASRISSEVHYHHTRPFKWAWIVLILATLSWIFAGALEEKSPRKSRIFQFSAMGLSVLGVALMIYGFALRVIIAGRPPVSNMYETVVWVGFGVMVFAGMIYWKQRQRVLMTVACAVSALTLMTADSAPVVLDPSISPLVPVLRSNLWLLVHVLTITISYAAFALALGLGNVALFHYIRGGKERSRAKSIHNLNQLAYRAVQFGVVLVAAGTILGGVWADYSWGRFWGWDPKETWALIVLLIYLAVLHGRFAGWVGSFGFAAMNVLSFMSVIMAWYGVNFVLGAGLHSYGFSTGGTPAVMTGVAIQSAYVLLAYLIYRRSGAAS